MSMFFSRCMYRPRCNRRDQTVRGGIDLMLWRVAHAGPENTHLKNSQPGQKIKTTTKSEFKKMCFWEIIRKYHLGNISIIRDFTGNLRKMSAINIEIRLEESGRNDKFA